MRDLLLGGFRRFHELALLVLRAHTAPARVALAVGVGCVIGCTPLFGLHFFLCLFFAYLLRLNQVIVYGAANISIPPLVPLIGGLSIEVGEFLLHGRWLAPDRQAFRDTALWALCWRFFSSWLLGGVIVGGSIGLVAGGVTYLVLRRRGRVKAGLPGPVRDEPHSAPLRAIERARGRYAKEPRRFRYYARMKYRMDPCYRAVLALVPPGVLVVDLGTGLGMLPVALGELGEGRRALGVEWDQAKAACGVRAAAGLPGVEIIQADMHTFDLPACDVVTLLDVLHYYDGEGQRRLLSRVAAVLRPGGVILIREADPGRRGGARFTRAVERWMVRLGWNRGPAVRFRPVAELLADLSALGFEAAEAEVAGALHPGNVLLRAVRSPVATI